MKNKLLVVNLGVKGGTVLYAQYILQHLSINCKIVQSKYEEERHFKGKSIKIPIKPGALFGLFFLLLGAPIIFIVLLLQILLLNKYKALFVLGSHWLDLVYIIPFRLLGKKVFYTIHEGVPREGMSMKKYIPISLKKSTDIIFLSEFVKNKTLSFHNLNKSTYVSNHGLFNAERNIEEKKINAPYSYLLIGHINQYKGVHLITEAMKTLDKNVYKHITIAGSFSIPEPAPHPKLNIINKYLSNQELHDLINEHDILLLPYTSASQSGVVTLALSYLKPTICSDIGGLKEQFGINGANYLEEISPAGLTKSIISINKDSHATCQIILHLKERKKELKWNSIVNKLEDYISNRINQ